MTAEIGESFTIEPGDPEEAQVARMLRRSEEYSHSLYPAESVHTLPMKQLKSPSVRFVVARAHGSGDLLGCGAVVLGRDGCAEVKRMFVDESARRRGVGAGVLEALELLVRAEGVGVIRLETGTGQPEAVALYRRFGYFERRPFGDYRDDPLSIFMEKSLDE
ncbi:MAG: GNAT family N-acetyltransferase [Pseudonocardiales bacterium]|nr:GNAT family N-acetyltransferase [Pseudonocardiales bacterium]